MPTSGEHLTSIHCEFEFSPTGSAAPHILQLQPSLERSALEVYYTDQETEDEVLDSTEVRRSDEDLSRKLESLRLKQVRPDELPALQYTVVSPSSIKKGRYYRSPIEIIGSVMYHFLPRALLTRYDEVDEFTTRVLGTLTGEFPASRYYEDEVSGIPRLPEAFKNRILTICESAMSGTPAGSLRQISLQRASSILERLKNDFRPRYFRDFLVSLPPGPRTSLSQRIVEEVPDLENILRAGRSTEYRTRVLALSDEYEAGYAQVIDYFQRSVKYLAPLRDEPKPVYPLSGTTDPTDVGLKGEHTAAVLDTNRSQLIEYVSPRAFQNPLGRVETTTDTLANAVHEWMRYMGVVNDVETADLGKLGHQLRVSTDSQNGFRDLTHVGVGVSQVLPIVVLALLAQPGATLIFEQPELHLHPRVQSRLADFFLSMSLVEKQCIVETHSEHIVNQLRHRVEDTGGDEVAKTIRIFFVVNSSG